MRRHSALTPIFDPGIRKGYVQVGSQIGSPEIRADVAASTVTATVSVMTPNPVIYGVPGTITGKGFNLDAASCTAATSFAFTATIAFSVGDWIVVSVGAQNSGTAGANPITTMSDAQGNTYTKQVNENCAQGVAEDGISLAMFTAPITTALATGDLITVNFSPSTTRKSVVAFRARPASGRTLAFVTAGSNNLAVSGTPTITTPSLVPNDYLIGGCARSDRDGAQDDGDTTRGTWSNSEQRGCDSGSDPTSVMTSSQAKIVTDFGTQTYNPTAPVGGGSGPLTQDNAIGYVVLRQT